MRGWEAREEDEDEGVEEEEQEEKEQPLDKLRGEGAHHRVAAEGGMMCWCGVWWKRGDS